MNIRIPRQPPKTRKSRKPETPEERFEREWVRVQTLQQEVRRLEEELDALSTRVIAIIAEPERAVADVLFEQTERLLSFCPKKSLTQWQRQILAEWLVENIQALGQQLFVDHLDVRGLANRTLAALEAFAFMPSARTHGSRTDASEDDFDPDADCEIPDHNDQLAAEERAFFERLYQEFAQEREHSDAEERKGQRSLDQLIKGSSINKLFRRIAGVLHPDREQDIALQKIRHQQMSELVEARDRGDVLKIFALYAEHVGESPLSLIDSDLDKVTQLLREQARRLQAEKQDVLYGDPLKADIYREFYSKSDQGIERKIRKHVEIRQQQELEERNITNCLTSLKALKPFLESRYEDREMKWETFARRRPSDNDY